MIYANNKHWIELQVKNNPDKVAIEKGKIKYTYTQLFDFVKKTASYLTESGIKENNHVAILAGNSIEFVIAVNALWLSGSVPVPINIRLQPKEINNLIKHSESVAVITINTDINLKEIKCNKKMVFGIDKIPNAVQSFREIDFNQNKTALLMYSSGSTGMPKCVELTYENLYSSTESFQAFTDSTNNDVWLASLPFYHIGGFSIITRSLLIGNKIVIPDSSSVKDLRKIFELHKPNYFSVVSTIMKRLLEEKIKPWNNLKSVFVGGGPVPEKLVSDCIKNNWPIVKVYGSTETASMVTAIDITKLKEKPTSAGKPLKNVKLKIIDVSGKELSHGKTGEIVVESNSIAKGYFNSNDHKIENGKYFTNDFGSLDVEGFLYVYGRKDDMVISGGENFHLKEIEEYVKTLDIIKDCATLKITDETWGESYILAVAAKVKSEKLKENIFNELKANISKYKHPKEIVFVNKIPRNELGKLNIIELKKMIDT